MGLGAVGPQPLLMEYIESVHHYCRCIHAPTVRVQVEKVLSVVCGQREGFPLLYDGYHPGVLPVPSGRWLNSFQLEGVCGNNSVATRSNWECHRWEPAVMSSFLRVANRLRPRETHRIPAWDMSLLLDALSSPRFEPLAQAELKRLSMKTAFCMAVTSAKRVGELHMLSISGPCL